MISYAQNREDVLLYRALRDSGSGVYLDVGAGHPTLHSVTRAFYDHGWSGVNVEPQPGMYQLLCRERTRDVNLQLGISDRIGSFALYIVHPEGDELGGLSTFDAPLAADYRLRGYAVRDVEVRVTTLAEVCYEHALKRVDFLKVDVEGWESPVLRGMDWSYCRPRIVVIESTVPASSEATHDRWEETLLAQDYRFAFFDGLNRYYVVAEQFDELGSRLRIPANPLDHFVSHETIQLIELQTSMNHLLRDTDPRTLQFGLWVARRLHKLKRRLRVA